MKYLILLTLMATTLRPCVKVQRPNSPYVYYYFVDTPNHDDPKSLCGETGNVGKKWGGAYTDEFGRHFQFFDTLKEASTFVEIHCVVK